MTMSSINASPALKMFIPDVSFLVITFCIALSGTILNSIELRLIWRKWRKATDFEVLLFHLAISDFTSAIGLVATACFFAIMYITNSYSMFYLWVSMALSGFFYMVSMKLVLIIGFERLLAIKLPLKHRLWHANRKILYRKICGAWMLSAIIISATVLSDYFVQTTQGPSTTGQNNTVHYVKGEGATVQNNTVNNVEDRTVTVSRNMGYAIATYMSCGVLALLIIYAWVSSLVVMRAESLLSVDKKDYKRDPKIMKLAKKKERATIIICRMVLLAFLVCNVPATVGLYRGNLDHISAHLSNLNTVANPLIYFFKGYIERCYSKKKIVLSQTESRDRLRDTRNKSELLSSEPIASDIPVEVNIVEENEADGGLPMSTDHARTSSWGKKQVPSLLQPEGINSEELGFENEVEVELSKPIDQGLGFSTEKGGEAFSEPAETKVSLEMGFVNTAAFLEELDSGGEQLESSNDNGERSLNMSELDTSL